MLEKFSSQSFITSIDINQMTNWLLQTECLEK